MAEAAPDNAGLVRRFEGPGPEVETLFLDAAFNVFQAQSQAKRLVTFEAGDAHLTLAGAGGTWASPVTGAFGGIAARRPQTTATVFALAQAATAWLRDEAASSAAIRMPPECFPDPHRAALENALFRLGWRLAHSDISYHLPTAPSEVFARGLGESKRQALRKLKALGAATTERTGAEAEAIHAAIAENHAARGFPMSMTWPQLRSVAERFPERVGLVAVERAGEVLAGAFVLRVAPGYDYVFNWGERPGFRRESPIILLAEGLMAGAYARGAEILDIGVATDRSIPNPGLIQFKELLGCAATAKRTWTLDLAPPAGGGGAR